MGQSASKKQEEPMDMVKTCTSYPHVVFREENFENDGQQRNVAVWSPVTAEGQTAPKIKAIVFVSHGLNEHTLCYHNIAAELVAQNMLVVGMDHMCHGTSAGRRGVISDYRRLYQDFVRFVIAYKQKLHQEFIAPAGAVEETHEVPSFVLAHSMGTLIAMRALMEKELAYPVIQAVILSGVPLFAGKGSASPFGIGCLYPLTRTSVAPCLLSCTSVMDPAGPTAPIVLSEICGNDEYTASLHLDKRRNPAILTNKTGYELLHLIEELKPMISTHFETPFFAIHGEKDSIALKAGAEFVFKTAKSDLLKRKLYVAQGLKHEVIHEKDPAGSKCRQMMVDYLLEEMKTTPVDTSGVVVQIE